MSNNWYDIGNHKLISLRDCAGGIAGLHKSENCISQLGFTLVEELEVIFFSTETMSQKKSYLICSLDPNQKDACKLSCLLEEWLCRLWFKVYLKLCWWLINYWKRNFLTVVFKQKSYKHKVMSFFCKYLKLLSLVMGVYLQSHGIILNKDMEIEVESNFFFLFSMGIFQNQGS